MYVVVVHAHVVVVSLLLFYYFYLISLVVACSVWALWIRWVVEGPFGLVSLIHTQTLRTATKTTSRNWETLSRKSFQSSLRIVSLSVRQSRCIGHNKGEFFESFVLFLAHTGIFLIRWLALLC